ncbi:MAG TPA: fatty acid desaturase [Steroidobacteraceae bacterium]|nr:fatty acid desaturase [Steroidobacteraceae bacterium]
MRTTKRRLEIPTLGVAGVIYGGFLLLTWFFRDLPLVIAAPLGSLLLAWYGSLQHETIHGHPTSSRRFNTMLAAMPLSLWIPYELYRDIHLRHHRHGGRYLTHPTRDTESYYLQPGVFAAAGRIRRVVYSAQCTLAGRLILGPALAILALWSQEIRKLRSGNRRHILIWLRHVLGVMIVLVWTVRICRVPLLTYVGLIVYPGIALTQLRSFVEHRADTDPALRTAVVEANPVWALLFLNNNLHIAHHAEPNLPWYQLPRAWRQMRDSASGSLAMESGLVFEGGYIEVARRYLFRPVITAEHPTLGAE